MNAALLVQKVNSTEIPFRSFLQAGFECSTHKRADGRRLDLLQSSAHDRFTLADYRQLSVFGIHTVRTAARWYLIESESGRYNFRSLAPTLDAARETGAEILLDLFHFGWPDYLDIFNPDFPSRFSRYVRALAQWLHPYRDIVTGFAPVNEISFLAWAGGDMGVMNPATVGRGAELKRILVRLALAASGVLRDEWPGVRLLFPEPMIHIIGNPERSPDDAAHAAAYSASQYQAWDMLTGRLAPELGGHPDAIDVVGVNFYARNQWVNYGPTLSRHDPRFRPFRDMLVEVWQRYRRPVIVSETGTEDDDRPGWFSYICEEVAAARQLGVPVQGICLYPILNVPGWNDDRHIHSGLFDYADEDGHREVYQPLADAIRREQAYFPCPQTGVSL